MITPSSAAMLCGAHRNIALTVREACFDAANDNDDPCFDHEELKDDDPALIRTALELFGEFGLGAAREAHNMAEQAFFAGHREDYAFWQSVCTKLDRRLARKLAENRTASTLSESMA